MWAQEADLVLEAREKSSLARGQQIVAIKGMSALQKQHRSLMRNLIARSQSRKVSLGPLRCDSEMDKLDIRGRVFHFIVVPNPLRFRTECVFACESRIESTVDRARKLVLFSDCSALNSSHRGPIRKKSIK